MDLLTKVNAALTSSSGITNVTTKQVPATASQYLLAETKNDGLYFAEDASHIYGLDRNPGLHAKSRRQQQTIYHHQHSDWQTPGGLSTYNGNVYVLDKKQNQILKYVSSASGYVKDDYFSSSAPDLSKAVSHDYRQFCLYSLHPTAVSVNSPKALRKTFR